MKKVNLLVAAIYICSLTVINSQTVNLKTASDSLSYAYGILLGNTIIDSDNSMKELINPEIIGKAMEAVFSGKNELMSRMAAMNYFETFMYAKMHEKMQENILKEESFLTENAKKPGVITTLSGLQYKVITEGKGKKPEINDNVELHYEGKFITGEIFDSSVQRGETVVFPVNGLIQGFSEGLQLMTVGSKYIFYIPSRLGYGENGAGDAIPPFTPLIFEVEIFKIVENE